MKINLFSFITIFIFVHSATYHMISTEAGEGQDAVLDVDGNEIRSYYVYYVKPVGGLGRITGILPYAVPTETCTYRVSGVHYALGDPVGFIQPSTALGAPILENTDLNITFAISTGCNSTDVWRKGERDDATGQSFVTIGVAGNPPPSYETKGNAFQIRKVADHDYYKFVYCAPTCIPCLEECEDVGIFSQDGGEPSHLAVGADSDNSFHIRFDQAYKPELARY